MLRDVGAFIHLPAVLSVPALIVCILADEAALAPGFLVCGLVSLGLGQALHRLNHADEASSLSGSMITVAGVWLITGLLCAIPFAWWGRTSGAAVPEFAAFGGFWTALFEAMSGITSTGLTMAADESLLPHAIQWWRSTLEWSGGIGVVVLALAFIKPTEVRKELFSAEARESRIRPTFYATAKDIWWVYCGLTALAVGGFLAVGMPWWEAVNHGLTGIATGGFSITSGSFADYGVAIRVVGIVIMLLGSLSFRIHVAAVRREWKTVLDDRVTRTLAGLFAGGLVAIWALDALTPGAPAFVDLAFQWASALGTCGFSSAPIETWATPVVLVLILGMFIGGAGGSTTGGIKVDRAILVALGPIWNIRRRISTRHGVQYYVIDGEKVAEREALGRYRGAVSLVSLYVGSILAGTFLLLLVLGSEFAPYQVLFEAVSAISNVGLSQGITDAGLPWVAKAVLIGLMWMGRLEIIAVLILIGIPWFLSSRSGARTS